MVKQNNADSRACAKSMGFFYAQKEVTWMADNKPTGRDSAGRFVKGMSGNPKGMKPMPQEVKEMLKAAAPEAVKLLTDTMHDPKAKIDLRVKCAETVLDRVYGKATQPIEGNLDNKIEIVLGGAAKYAR